MHILETPLKPKGRIIVSVRTSLFFSFFFDVRFALQKNWIIYAEDEANLKIPMLTVRVRVIREGLNGHSRRPAYGTNGMSMNLI